MKTNTVKRRSFVAKEVRSPKYRQRIVDSKKIYNRKRVSCDEF